MDGTETKGSSTVSVITKYGRHTKFIYFQVWIPELPVEVTLSDNQLSQIKGWKVPNQPTRSRSVCLIVYHVYIMETFDDLPRQPVFVCKNQPQQLNSRLSLFFTAGRHVVLTLGYSPIRGCCCKRRARERKTWRPAATSATSRR